MSTEVPERFRGLSSEERFVAVLAERVLGVSASAWDTEGKQAAVDIRLVYPDGRTAGLEVMRSTTSNRGQLESLLGRRSFELPAPDAAKWYWSATVENVRDLPQLEERIDRIIILSEARGLTHPAKMWAAHEEPDIEWLLGSSVAMFGHPSVPARAIIHVMPAGGGGAVDDDFGGLNAFLAQLFEDEAKHVEKTVGHEADERHLCFLVDQAGATFTVADAISRSPNLPRADPPMPAGLTHLWLIGRPYGGQVLIWSAGTGWFSRQLSEFQN